MIVACRAHLHAVERTPHGLLVRKRDHLVRDIDSDSQICHGRSIGPVLECAESPSQHESTRSVELESAPKSVAVPSFQTTAMTSSFGQWSLHAVRVRCVLYFHAAQCVSEGGMDDDGPELRWPCLPFLSGQGTSLYTITA